MSQITTPRIPPVLTQGTWQIDPTHSSVSFVARHLMVAKVRGGFRGFTGSIEVDEIPERSRIDVTIDAASIDTGAEARDQHLRSPDFLDVDTYPSLRYRSTGLEITGDATFLVKGELTIRDVTRPVTLEASFEGETTDPWGNTRAVFSAQAEIDREDWGITWNQALETGGLLVGKKVKLEMEVTTVRAAGEVAA